MKYIIKDWAGNTCFQGREFDTFEDAWGFLYGAYDHLQESEFDEQMSEYEVEHVSEDTSSEV